MDWQFKLEIKLENALREEGFTDESIYETRAQWRRAAFSIDSREEFMSPRSIKYFLKKENIKLCRPYTRIKDGFKLGSIKLQEPTEATVAPYGG